MRWRGGGDAEPAGTCSIIECNGAIDRCTGDECARDGSRDARSDSGGGTTSDAANSDPDANGGGATRQHDDRDRNVRASLSSGWAASADVDSCTGGDASDGNASASGASGSVSQPIRAGLLGSGGGLSDSGGRGQVPGIACREGL